MREWLWEHIVLPWEMLRIQIETCRRKQKRDAVDWRFRR